MLSRPQLDKRADGLEAWGVICVTNLVSFDLLSVLLQGLDQVEVQCETELILKTARYVTLVSEEGSGRGG